jgi:hypothetical protein
MRYFRIRTMLAAGFVASSTVLGAPLASAADLDPPSSKWTGSFSLYSWLPWISGDASIGPVDLNVDVGPNDLLSNLDWSRLPVWMSYGELRTGRLTLFNDIVWTALQASEGFDRKFVSGSVDVDFSQLTVELGAAYAIWTDGASTVDVLAGGRYWRQEADVFLAASAGPVGGAIARSGAVDWVDPFVGARLQQVIAPGQSLVVRGDIGGFGAGSDFSWQAMATYNMELCVTEGHKIDGYIGYRALSVDYSEGNYSYDAVQQGPVLGLTMNF